MFERFERSLLKEEYGEFGLPSPIEGNLNLKEVAKEKGDYLDLSILSEQTPPEPVRKAAADSALEGGYIKNYLPLREVITQFYKEKRNVDYDTEDEIFLTCGGQQALDGAFKLLVNPGDKVVMGEPEYAPNEPAVNFFGGTVETVPLSFNDQKWGFDADAFREKVSPATKLVIITSPNNPAGYVYREEDIETIADIVEENDCWLINDEIWASLTTNRKVDFKSLAAVNRIKKQTVTIFSFSKTFGMSGYRIGAILGPSELIRAMNQVLRFTTMSVPTMSQIAACEALDFDKTGDWLNARIERIMDRIDETVDRFKKYSKLKCARPESGVFLFPYIGDYGMSSLEFCKKLLKEKGVKVIPGYFYGKNSDGYVRISMSVPDDEFQEGMERFLQFIEEQEN